MSNKMTGDLLTDAAKHAESNPMTVAKSDDLVERLRAPWSWFSKRDDGTHGPNNLAGEAANRIEELEVKLAKAVEALESISGKVPYADDPWDIASDALADIKKAPDR